MRFNLVHICLVFLAFAVQLPLRAQDQKVVTYSAGQKKTYSIEDGLPDNCVEYFFIDSLGIMNIVPCRHVQLSYNQVYYQLDGYRTLKERVFRSSEPIHTLNPLGYSKRGKNFGYMYKPQREFIAKPKILYEFDPVTGIIDQYRIPEYRGKKIFIANVLENPDGYTVLAYSGATFYIVHFQNGKFEVLHELETVNEIIGYPVEYPFYESEQAFYFSGTDKRIYAIDKATGKAAVLFDFMNSKFSQLISNTYQIVEGPKSRIYFVLKYHGAILAYNESTRVLESPGKSIPSELLPPFDTVLVNTDFSGNHLFILVQDGKCASAFLLDQNGDFGNFTGVIQFLEEDGFYEIDYKNFLSHDFKKDVFELGYEFKGVDIITTNGIEAFPSRPGRGLNELSQDTIYINAGRAIIRKPGGFEFIEDFRLHRDLRFSDSELIKDKNGAIWKYQDNNRLVRIDPATRKVVYFDFNANISRFVPAAKENTMYVLTENELIEWDYTKNEKDVLADASGIGFVNKMLIDHQTLWIATSFGLYSKDLSDSTGIVQVENTTLHQAINYMHQDRSGRLWLGTFSNGLIVYDIALDTCTQIKKENGLSNNNVATIIADDQHDIWIATFNGITVLSEAMENIGHVYQFDGLIDNECNRWSVLKISRGELIFGSPNGFSVIKPETVKEKIRNKSNPSIYLTGIQYSDSISVRGTDALQNAVRTGIRLKAANKNIKISYALSEYISPGRNRYAYQLEGYDKDWNYIGGIHDLTLTNLPRGKYHIRIKGADRQGQWSQNIIAIPVYAESFFYQTTWFYMACVAALALLIFSWAYRQRQIRLSLESTVRSRTQKISQQAEDLKELDQLKSKLYTNITHEFRTPLTIIHGLAKQIKGQPKISEIISRNTMNLLELVNQMLDLRKLETGKMKLNEIQSDIVAYVFYLGESFSSIAASKGIAVEYHAEARPILMDFDPEKLKRIISNLLSNAIKFSEKGGKIKIDIARTPANKELILKVEDTGTGIPRSEIPHIFNRYHQADDEHSRKGKGTGIGLTICAELVALMGGTIHVESESGKGSCFTVRLPIRQTAGLVDKMVPEEMPSLTSSIPVSKADLENEIASLDHREERDNILLVEDNQDVLYYLLTCLKDRYNLHIAQNGLEGIQKALYLVPSLILSDVMMPEKDGFELCETLKHDLRTSHIPVVLLTARADVESRISGLKFGADDYLAKPFNEEELLARITNLIRIRSELQKRYNSFDQFDEPGNATVEQQDKFILEFRQMISEHMDDESFGIPEMCKYLGMGKSHLHEKIKSLTGKTPIHYMRSIKMHHASQLIKRGGMTISEVAFEVGYSDPKYFSKVFKSEYGISPSQYV